MAMSQSVDLAHAQSTVPCNVCADESPGEYYCIECKQTFCPQCENVHRKVASSKDHNVILRTQITDIDITIPICTDHGETASCDCRKCNMPVCIKCITGKHNGHAMYQLPNILEREKKILQDKISSLQNVQIILQNQRLENISKKEQHKKKIQQITRDMEDERNACIQEIQRIHGERVIDINAIRTAQLEAFDGFAEDISSKIGSYENKISDYEDIIAQNSLQALIDVAKTNVPLPDVGMKPDLPDPPSFIPGCLHSIGENLGKLHLTSPLSGAKPSKKTTPIILSKIECPLKGYPRICVTKGGEVWLGAHECRILVMMDMKGRVLRCRNIQNRPSGLAVLDNGDIIISPYSDDSRAVTMLLRDGSEQTVFDTSPSCSWGISVTACQEILICTQDGRVIRTESDGSKFTQIFNGCSDYSAIHAVEGTNGRIFISNYKNRVIVVINKDGTVLSTITHTAGGHNFLGPWRFAVDRLGNVLFTDWYENRFCLYIIDQNLQSMELMSSLLGVQHPRLLAIDNDNNLWITQINGTVLVLKYLST